MSHHIYRDAESGRIVTEEYAQQNPDTTVREAVKEPSGKRHRFRITFEADTRDEIQAVIRAAVQFAKAVGHNLSDLQVDHIAEAR